MSKDKLIIPSGEAFRDADPTPRQRLPYGAVPLDPWRANFYHPAQPYVNSSMRGIYKKLQATMVEQDWFRHDGRSYQLHKLMEESLRHSHLTRIEKNADIDLSLIEGLDHPLLEYAKTGTATPEELFTLLVDRPALGSLELAKLSHPFDLEASHEMDEAMVDLILALASENEEPDKANFTSTGQILDDKPRYKVKRVDAKLPAAVVLRKQDLMDFPVDEWGAKVRMVWRQGFLVFNGEGVEDGAHFEHLLTGFKNPKFNALRNEALGARIEEYVEKHPLGRPYGWVQPQASSYYAKYIPVKPVAI